MLYNVLTEILLQVTCHNMYTVQQDVVIMSQAEKILIREYMLPVVPDTFLLVSLCSWWFLMVPYWFLMAHYMLLMVPYWFLMAHYMLLMVPYWFLMVGFYAPDGSCWVPLETTRSTNVPLETNKKPLGTIRNH